MMNSSNSNWHDVSGIDSDGDSIKGRLDGLIGGKLPYEEQIELLVDLCRDGVASTAGYAAIPLLLVNNCPDPRARWEMAMSAGLIISCAGNAASPPVPPDLAVNLGGEVRGLVRAAILKSASDADLGPAELIDSLSVALSMLGREDLSHHLGRLALKEYGVG